MPSSSPSPLCSGAPRGRPPLHFRPGALLAAVAACLLAAAPAFAQAPGVESAPPNPHLAEAPVSTVAVTVNPAPTAALRVPIGSASGDATDGEARATQTSQGRATLSLSPNPVDEGSPVTVTATLSEPASTSVTIPVTITDNTAESDDRGTLTSISISRGATTGTGTITTNQDDDADDETFTVALGALASSFALAQGAQPPAFVVGTPVEVTIKDDETLVPLSVSLSASPSTVQEGRSVTVTATLTQAATQDVTIPLDVEGVAAQLTIRRGQKTGTYEHRTGFVPDGQTKRERIAIDAQRLASVMPRIKLGEPFFVDVTVVDTKASPRLSNLVAEGAGSADGPFTALEIGTFAPGTTSYTVSVPHGTTHARLKPASSKNELLVIKTGVQGGTLTQVASGGGTGPAIALAVGGNVLVVQTWFNGQHETYSVRVERAAAPPPLTASFEKVPEDHEVKKAFTLDVRFSEALGDGGAGPTVASFDVRAGKAKEVEDLGGGLWRVRVKPGSWRDVVVTLAGGRACGAADAVCTADGRALSNTVEASVGGPVRIRIQDGKAREGKHAGIDFAVTLSRASSATVSVDYATADGTAKAGEDYEAVSGTVTFAAGETEKKVHVAILDDDVDEGREQFEMRLSNESGAHLRRMHRKATGTIRNTDMIPAALLARFGRATAEQVVTQIEERMAAPRRRGFRARFAGRELRPGQERDFALGLVSQLAPMGMGSHPGAGPLGTGSHAAGAGAFGLSTGGMPGAMGMTGRHALMGGYGPAGASHGGGLVGSMGMDGDLFSSSELELNRESRGGMLSLWSRSSRSQFSGMEDALSLNGDVRTTMVGADYSRGALTVGLSVGRTHGLGGYRGTSGGEMSTSMTGVYPWVGYQVNDRVSVWGTTGYGTGSLSLTPDAASALETGVSMMMSAVGTRGELLGSRATGGFALAFKADALWVGAASDLVEGPAGRLNASEAAVTRVRTALEGSRGFTLGGGLSLRPSVELGVRRDGGDAETGAGVDVGGGLVFSDTVTGLSLDVRMRTLVVHQAEGFSERGLSLSFGWDATPSSPLGLTARVAPSWGGSAQSGAEALWSSQTAYGMGSHQMYGSGGQVAAEVGYGLPVGARFVGTPRVGLTTSEHGRDYRVGYGLGVLDRGKLNFELGVDAQRREMPTQGQASNGFMGRGTLGW